MLVTPYDSPKEVDDAVRAALARDLPERVVSKTRVCAEEPSRFVVRAYLPVEGLRPTPYVIYSVARDTLAAKRLNERESEPYAIQNYK